VTHQLADGDVRLAVGGELRPVARDRRIEVQFSPVGQQQGGQGRHGLGGGIDVDDGVAFPRAGFLRVGPATPDVDDRLALERGAERCAEVGSAREICVEGGARPGEPVVGESFRGVTGHGVVSPVCCLVDRQYAEPCGPRQFTRRQRAAAVAS